VHAPHRDVHQFNVRRSHRAHVKPPVVTMHNTFATPQTLIRRTAQALPCAPATITRSASHGAAISTSAAMTTGRAATSIAVTGRAKPLSGDQVRHDLRDLWVQHSLVAFWDLHRRPKLKPCRRPRRSGTRRSRFLFSLSLLPGTAAGELASS
jgi:hypothetical protein